MPLPERTSISVESPEHVTSNNAQSTSTLQVLTRTITLLSALLVASADKPSSAQEIADNQSIAQSEKDSTPEQKDFKQIYIESAEAQKAIEEMQTCLEMMNSNTYMIREKGSKNAMKIISSLHRKIHPFPEELRSALSTVAAESELSPEQEYRLRHVWRHAIDPDAPIRLPPEEATGKEVLDYLKNIANIRIEYLEEDMEERLHRVIKIQNGNNSVSQILKTICLQTGSYPVFKKNGVIVLTRQRERERTLIATEQVLGVMKTKQDKHTGKPYDHIDLRYNIGTGKLLTFQPTDLNGTSRHPPDTTRLHGGHRPKELHTQSTKSEWGNTHKGIVPKEKVHVSPASGRDTPHLELHAITAGGMQNVQFALDHFEGGKQIGFQDIHLNKEQNTENGTWVITVNIGVFSEIPWPATPCQWDTVGFTAAEKNEYTVHGIEKEIPAKKMSVKRNQRKMVFTMECEDEPHIVDIRVPTTLQQQTLSIPLPAEKLPRRTIGKYDLHNLPQK